MTRWTRGFVASLVTCVVAACSSRTPPGPIQISLVADAAPAFVRLAGLSSEELAGLPATDQVTRWQELLSVRVPGADLPVAGRYLVNGPMLEFHPRFPFDAGRSYDVRFDSAKLAAPRNPVVTETVVT